MLAVTGGRRPASPHLSVLRRDLSTFRYWATAALSHNRGQHLPLLADGGLLGGREAAEGLTSLERGAQGCYLFKLQLLLGEMQWSI